MVGLVNVHKKHGPNEVKKKKKEKNISKHWSLQCFYYFVYWFFFPMEIDVIIPMGRGCTGAVCLKEEVLFK